MLTLRDVGSAVKYWTYGKASGAHTGTLIDIQGTVAVIKHPVKKRAVRVSLSECELIGENKMTIYDNLLKATNIGPQKEGQSDINHLVSILQAVADLPAEGWTALPNDVKQWFNDAARAHSSAQPLPPCPGFVGKDTIKESLTMKEPTKGKSAKEVFATQVAPTPQAASIDPSKKKTTGVTEVLRRTVILHPDWTSRQLYDYLRNNGFPNAKLDTISVDGGNVRRVIELAKEMGYWKEPETAKANTSSTGAN